MNSYQINMPERIIYLLILVLLTAMIWGQLYTAQFLKYDKNFGQLLMTFLSSVVLFVTGIVMLIKKLKIVTTNIIATIAFLMINSPLTVFMAVRNYEIIFGVKLHVG